ncbi:hypothetical protein [Leptolyngbya sp. GGD]|uniref:hypothetical protein n=1 Tax=Leptolyngbya sp. GGD TaxID=2997907 RepID=UPI00227D5F4E|nr:hypothetical protein [Leptolyngbya sp. GGD]MCY6494257.1 hypothetical protein [Leptolyngbya sp. GGD]
MNTGIKTLMGLSVGISVLGTAGEVIAQSHLAYDAQMASLSNQVKCVTWSTASQELTPDSGGRGGIWLAFNELPKAFQEGCMFFQDNNSLDVAYILKNGLQPHSSYTNGDLTYLGVPSIGHNNREGGERLEKLAKQGKALIITWLTPTNGSIPYLRSLPKGAFRRGDGMTCLSTVCMYSAAVSHQELSRLLEEFRRPKVEEQPPSLESIVPSGNASPRQPSANDIALLNRQVRMLNAQGTLPQLNYTQSQERKSLQNQSSKFLAPFVGGWMTPQGDRYYVYPSIRKDRQACIIVEKSGAPQTLQIGVAVGGTIGTDLSMGKERLFNTKQPNVLGLRRSGSDTLLPALAAPMAVELTAGNREAMEQNGCIIGSSANAQMREKS